MTSALKVFCPRSFLLSPFLSLSFCVTGVVHRPLISLRRSAIRDAIRVHRKCIGKDLLMNKSLKRACDVSASDIGRCRQRAILLRRILFHNEPDYAN